MVTPQTENNSASTSVRETSTPTPIKKSTNIPSRIFNSLYHSLYLMQIANSLQFTTHLNIFCLPIFTDSPELKTLDLRDDELMNGDPLHLLVPEIVMKEESKPDVEVVDLEEEEMESNKARSSQDDIYLVNIQDLIGSKSKPDSFKSNMTPVTATHSTAPCKYPKVGPKSRCQPKTSTASHHSTSPRTYPKVGPKSQCQPQTSTSCTPILLRRTKPGPKSRCQVRTQLPPPPTPVPSGLLAQSINVAAIHIPTNMVTLTENGSNSYSDIIIPIDEREITSSCRSLDSIQPSIPPASFSSNIVDYFLRDEMNGLVTDTPPPPLSNQFRKEQVCNICNKSFLSGNMNLRKHMRLHHPQEFEQEKLDDYKESVCDDCGRNFTSLYTFKWHRHTVHSHPYDDN